MRVQFCPNCSRIIDYEFRFCPWCGTWAHDTPDMAATLGKSLSRLDRYPDDHVSRKMAKMGKELAELEHDLDGILELKEKESHIV